MADFKAPPRWDAIRRKTHEAMYPPEEKQAHNALAQARYRERNATRIRATRRLTALRAILHEVDLRALCKLLRRG